jgi:hypothetical protein
VGAGTSFYADQTRWHVHGVPNQLLPAETLLDDDVASLAQANQSEIYHPITPTSRVAGEHPGGAPRVRLIQMTTTSDNTTKQVLPE